MLPPGDLTQILDIRPLTYVSPNPNERESFQLQGPCGITLHLRIVMPLPELAFSRNRDAVLYLPNLVPLWSQDSPSIDFQLSYKPLVRVTITEDEIADLPEEPALRSAALIAKIAMFLDPETTELKHGSEQEMSGLLQAFSSLANLPVEIMSSVNASDKVTIKTHGKYGWISASQITPVVILDWFSPISSLPNFFSDIRADVRKPHRTVIKPKELTAHDRLEAISSIVVFLKARYEEGRLSHADIRKALSELNSDEETITGILKSDFSQIVRGDDPADTL